MAQNPSLQSTPSQAQSGTAPDVTTWKLFTDRFVILHSNAETILQLTPPSLIFSQHDAEIVHAAMMLEAKICPGQAPDIVKHAFVRWAWNITPEGELKEVPHLTVEDRELWYQLMGSKTVLSEIPECFRRNMMALPAPLLRKRGVDEEGRGDGREKRARIMEPAQQDTSEEVSGLAVVGMEGEKLTYLGDEADVEQGREVCVC